MPLPELHAAWVPGLPPPVGMAYPFTQEKIHCYTPHYHYCFIVISLVYFLGLLCASRTVLRYWTFCNWRTTSALLLLLLLLLSLTV